MLPELARVAPRLNRAGEALPCPSRSRRRRLGGCRRPPCTRHSLSRTSRWSFGVAGRPSVRPPFAPNLRITRGAPPLNGRRSVRGGNGLASRGLLGVRLEHALDSVPDGVARPGPLDDLFSGPVVGSATAEAAETVHKMRAAAIAAERAIQREPSLSPPIAPRRKRMGAGGCAQGRGEVGFSRTHAL